LTGVGVAWSSPEVEPESSDQKTSIKPASACSAETTDDLERLYYQHRKEILRFLRRTFGDGPPDPEDVIQVVFERFAAIAKVEQVQNARAFLFRSARNYVIDERRRQAVRSEFASAALVISDRSDDLDAERVIDSRERWAAIEVAIGKLDARSREMLLMNRIHDLSYAEIARRKGCSATQVKSLVARALVACHRAVSEQD
jgi:RNA polymerase sigma factor (sigma-70 family)